MGALRLAQQKATHGASRLHAENMHSTPGCAVSCSHSRNYAKQPRCLGFDQSGIDQEYNREEVDKMVNPKGRPKGAPWAGVLVARISSTCSGGSARGHRGRSTEYTQCPASLMRAGRRGLVYEFDDEVSNDQDDRAGMHVAMDGTSCITELVHYIGRVMPLLGGKREHTEMYHNAHCGRVGKAEGGCRLETQLLCTKAAPT